jgi:two-component system sensor histidine kinase CpxA
MIGRLLTLARLEATTLAEMRPTDLNALLAEIVADAPWEAGQGGCRVDLVSDASCEIHASPDLLRSAVENVIRNAVRYTASGTPI